MGMSARISHYKLIATNSFNLYFTLLDDSVLRTGIRPLENNNIHRRVLTKVRRSAGKEIKLGAANLMVFNRKIIQRTIDKVHAVCIIVPYQRNTFIFCEVKTAFREDVIANIESRYVCIVINKIIRIIHAYYMLYFITTCGSWSWQIILISKWCNDRV